jgi:hypothetical protein
MPKLDGTGPQGQGPRTGRGLGNCCGAGQGRGCFSCVADKVLTKEEQKKALEVEKKSIEQKITDLDA